MGTGNVTPGLPWDKLASVQTQLIPWGFKSLPADWAASSMGTHGVAGACWMWRWGVHGQRALCSGQGFRIPGEGEVDISKTGKLRLGKAA